MTENCEPEVIPGHEYKSDEVIASFSLIQALT
jgi:hypothetical protein